MMLSAFFVFKIKWFFFQKMPLSAKEKQRRFRERINQDPIKREAYLKKERERWKQRKQSGKVKGVKDMTEREQRSARKAWRTKQAKYRAKFKQASVLPSPPPSPVSVNVLRSRKQRIKCRKLKREVDNLKVELTKQTRLAMKYKKRLQRCTQQRGNSLRDAAETPRKATERLLRFVGTRSFKKKLMAHVTIAIGVRERYKQEKNERERKKLKCLAANALTKKYHLQGMAHSTLGIPRCRNAHFSRRSYNCKSKKVDKIVENFYLRDDNSRSTAGVKETKTYHSVKKQKRLLLYTMSRLHEKFQAEFPLAGVSYSLFCKLRPFWVLPPKESDRETCLCKIHENIRFAVTKLHSLKAIDYSDSMDLVKKVTCSTTSQKCMYGNCSLCKELMIPVNSFEECADEECAIFPLKSNVDRNLATKWFHSFVFLYFYCCSSGR